MMMRTSRPSNGWDDEDAAAGARRVKKALTVLADANDRVKRERPWPRRSPPF